MPEVREHPRIKDSQPPYNQARALSLPGQSDNLNSPNTFLLIPFPKVLPSGLEQPWYWAWSSWPICPRLVSVDADIRALTAWVPALHRCSSAWLWACEAKQLWRVEPWEYLITSRWLSKFPVGKEICPWPQLHQPFPLGSRLILTLLLSYPRRKLRKRAAKASARRPKPLGR